MWFLDRLTFSPLVRLCSTPLMRWCDGVRVHLLYLRFISAMGQKCDASWNLRAPLCPLSFKTRPPIENYFSAVFETQRTL